MCKPLCEYKFRLPFSAMFLFSNPAHHLPKPSVELNFKHIYSFGKVKSKVKLLKVFLCCSSHAQTVTQALLELLSLNSYCRSLFINLLNWYRQTKPGHF